MALWIDKKRYIFELPHCELLHKNTNNEFICGEPSEEDEGSQGEWGMCVLEGFSAPQNCPISEFYKNWRNKSMPFVMVDGFRIVEKTRY